MSRSFRGVVLRNGCCPNSAGPNLGQQPFRYIQQSAVPDTVQRNIEGYKTVAVSNLGHQKWDGDTLQEVNYGHDTGESR